MKKIISFLILLTSLQVVAQFHHCKEDLFPVRDPKKKMFGYVNIMGDWKIRPYYDLARPFREGIAVVSRRSRFGLISCLGNVVLSIDYEEIKDFVNGFSWVQKDELWGLVNHKGELVLECKYQEVVDISRFDDYAWVKTGGKWGVYDKAKATFIHEPAFDKYQQMSHQFSLVELNGKKGMIEHSKPQKVLEIEYESIDKFAPYLLAIQKDGKYGVTRDNGKQLLEPVYDELQNLGIAKFSVSKGGKYAVYDVWGEEFVPFVLDSVGVFKHNISVVKIDGSYGYINYKGQKILKKYVYATEFRNGIAMVKEEDGKFRLISRRGEQVSAVYEQIKLFDTYYAGFDGKAWRLFTYAKPTKEGESFLEVYNGLPSRVRVKTNEGVRFYSVLSHVFVSDLVFDSIEGWEGDYAKVGSDNGVGLIDSSLKVVIEPKYEAVEVVEYMNVTYLKVLTKETLKYGLIMPSTKQIIAEEYDELTFAGRNMFIVCKEGKCGLVNHKKEVLIPEGYEEMMVSDSLEVKYMFPLIVKVKGKYGLIEKDGSLVLKPKCTKIDYLGLGYYKIDRKGKTSFVNRVGEEMEESYVYKKLKNKR